MSIALVNEYINTSEEFKDKWFRIWNEDLILYELRILCWELFLEEYWTTFFDGIKNFSPKDLGGQTKCLFEKIIEYLEQKCSDETDHGQKVSLKYLQQKLQTEYGENPYTLFKKYEDYSERERILVQNMDRTAHSLVPIRDLTDEIARLKEDLDRKLNLLSAEMDHMALYTEHTPENQAMLASLHQKNGTQQPIQSLNMALKQLQQNIEETKQEIHGLISRLQENASQAFQRLREKMVTFKKEIQMEYVDLKSSGCHVPLELEEGYASLGKSMFELLRFTVLNGRQLNVNLQADFFKALLQQTLMDSFVTLDQKKHNIKVELGTKKQKKKEIWQGDDFDDEISSSPKFKCPKFSATVRLLAADKIDSKVKVKAQFCQEEEVNLKYSTGKWDSPCRFHLKRDTDETLFEKKKAQACFKKLELENFERKQQDRHVCEDKFRLLFTTSILIADDKIDIQTISLPIVVTTGASQICNVYGSLLWQCYSAEDAFSMPICSVEEMPWSKVFDMLDKKFLTLKGRNLSEDEKKHLGARLMQYNDNEMIPGQVCDTTTVPFRKFCIDKMMDIKEGDDKKKSATFWMWFHAVFNLVKNHLHDYWIDNLIAGFVSKASTRDMLLIKAKNPCKGLYLLRFSDKVITDGQGQNVCGAITVAFVLEYKGKLKVEHATPFKAETFKKKCLASNVKNMTISDNGKEDTICKILYPTEKSTEEVFENYSNDNKNSKREKDDYVAFVERLTIQMNGLTTEDKDGNRPKKRASRPSKRGGKMQRGVQESSVWCQQSPADSTCSSQIPMTVMEQEGSSDSMDQIPSSSSFDEGSNDHMLVCPQPMQVSQQQIFSCQEFGNDSGQSAIFTSTSTMFDDQQITIDNLGGSGSFLDDLNAPWDGQQDSNFLLQNISVQQQQQQDQHSFQDALYNSVDPQNPVTSTQTAFPDQSVPTSTMQSVAPAASKRTPSLENPTLASLLQPKQPPFETSGDTVVSQSSAPSQRHSDPIVLTATVVSTNQSDLALNTGQPLQVSRSVSLGERKIQPSKPLASKIESFEKLTNKLQIGQTPCSENFPVAPSPADSGISVNSPINPNLIMGDGNGGQLYSLGESPPRTDNGNIPNVIEQDTTDRFRSENSVIDGNATLPLSQHDWQTILTSLPNEQIQIVLSLLQNIQGQQGQARQVQGTTEMLQSSPAPHAVYNNADSTMSPDVGSPDQMTELQEDYDRKQQQ